MESGKVETLRLHVEDPELEANFSPIVIGICRRQRLASDTQVGEDVRWFGLEVRVP